jgi:hypothetical protein
MSTMADDDLLDFLTDRLTEDLARIWARGRPGMAVQVAAIDALLRRLAAGRLPDRGELRLLLYGYGAHPAYEPRWTERLLA